MRYFIGAGMLLLSNLVSMAMAQDRIKLESIYIKGNKEFPQISYTIPWKDMKTKDYQKQAPILHSLFGDLFDPVYEVATTSEHPQILNK